MLSLDKGNLPLFRFLGVNVYLHWTWFVLAAYSIMERRQDYLELFYAVAEVLALFGIVLLHEYGHALACRQSGGSADRIVLWPLGGVAFVRPVHRPGALLWSIAAGPLVNLVLAPCTWLFMRWAEQVAVAAGSPDLPRYGEAVFYINTALLLFNLLPVYPLDGGQILQALLWLGLGYARSLYAAALLGLLGVVALVVISQVLNPGSLWMVILAVFLGTRCWQSFQFARGLLAAERR